MYNYNSFMGYTPYQTKTEIIRVNGENGARLYALPPNSSAILLDETAPKIWLVQTDGAGYKTLTPYEIKPCKGTESLSVSSFEERIKRLETVIYEKSDNRPDDEKYNKPSDDSAS